MIKIKVVNVIKYVYLMKDLNYLLTFYLKGRETEKDRDIPSVG